MALTLSQLVDLAIGSDVPSVNFRHLRDVLVTVVKVLNLNNVPTKTGASGSGVLNDVETEDALENSFVLHEDENTSDIGDHTNRDSPSINVDQNGELGSENEILSDNEINNNHTSDNAGRKSPNIIEKDHTIKNKGTKASTTQNSHQNVPYVPPKTANLQSSVLSSKVHALEEGLKSLRSIVGDLISHGDFGGETSDSLIKQLKSAEGSLEIFDTVPFEKRDNVQDSLVSRVSEQQQQQVVQVTRRASAKLSRECSGKTTSKRPATQPVLGDHAGNRSSTTRGKSRGELNGGKRTPVNVVSTPIKAKEQKYVSTKDGASKTGQSGITRVMNDNPGDVTKKTVVSPLTPSDTDVPKSIENGISSDLKDDVGDHEDNKMVDAVEGDMEGSPSDPNDPLYAIRHELNQVEAWREKLSAVQEEFRSEIGICKKSVQKIQADIEGFRLARNAQDAERFNAVHHVHNLVMELDDKHSKTLKTLHNLVDEFNRHDRTFNEVFDAIEKLDESKVDNVMLSSEVGNKANKDELRDKVSLSTFDETFSLLDRGLSDALEKMANQMSMEEALRETLNELESGMESKLNRDEMDKLKSELESRIKEVQALQKRRELEGKTKIVGDPAGFKRKPETVRCISCDRDMEIGTAPNQVPPSLPKARRMVGNHVNRAPLSRDGHVSKKTEENECRPVKMKAEILQGTALHDFVSFPISQRFCGGGHTIIRGKQRSQTTSHFNDYVVIRNDPNSVVTLPPREFILPKESVMGSRFLKQKLPAIPEAGSFIKPTGDIPGVLTEGDHHHMAESTKCFETKSTFTTKIPVCKNDNE